MDDRTLLSKAAKAAGIVVESWTTYGPYYGGLEGCIWNPLVDDGDALRLAVKLGIGIDPPGPYFGSATEALISPRAHIKECVGEDGDPYAATRRAITRAAAALEGE